MCVSRHLTMSSGKMDYNRLNMLFSPFHDSYFWEQCYREKTQSLLGLEVL